MDYSALIVISYIYIAIFGFLTGRYLLPGKRRIFQALISVLVFLAIFIFLWLMVYFLMDISLYDIFRQVTRTTLGIFYIAVFRAYIFVFLGGMWANEIYEYFNKADDSFSL
jgi:hypothetical protein